MNHLSDIQERFSRSLMDNNDTISCLLTETEKPALSIYINAYRIRLQETLAKDYSALAQLMGRKDFNSMTSAYIQEFPSISYSLRNFGEHLARFLAADLNYRQQTYLAELAAFEWQLNDVFDLADTAIANVEDMSMIAPDLWPNLHATLHSSIRWLNLKWNIAEQYPALKQGSSIDLTEYSMPKRCLIWRQNHSPYYRILDEQEAMALAILQKKNFSELCMFLSNTSTNQNNVALQAATYLKSWLVAGLIESVSY